MVELTREEEREIVNRVRDEWVRGTPDMAPKKCFSLDPAEGCRREIHREMNLLLAKKAEAEEVALLEGGRPEREEGLRVKRLLLRGQRRRFVRSSC